MKYLFFCVFLHSETTIHTMKKPLKITLIVLGSIIAFVLLVLLFVTLFGGNIAKNYVNKHAEELLGRKANVEHVGINLFSGHVAVNGLSVKEENGTDQFAGFDTLDVSVKLGKLLSKEVYVRHITLAGLDVQVLQNGSTFNFTSLIDHFKKDTAQVEEEKDTTPSDWVINLHNIRLNSERIYYADLQRNSHWGINEFNLIVPDFCIGGNDDTDAGLTLALAEGGELKADAAYNAVSNDFNVKLSITNFALNQAKPYVVDMANIEDIEGRLGIDAQATGNLSKIMDMVVSAKASIDGVNVLDNHSHSVASLQHLGVDLNKLVLSQNLYDISSVELRGLEARYELFADSTNTFSRLMKPKKITPDTTQAEKQPADTASQQNKAPMQLRLGHLSLSDINFTYADHTMPDDFVFPVTKIRVEADDVTLNGNNNARIFAGLPNGGTAMINWSGNISDWKSNQSLRLNIKNLHLTDLSPYMVAYLGQPFTDGVFSFTSYNTIRNSNLDGKNRIDIYKPTVGERRKDVKDAKHLPIKAALYILKDKDDKVILDVPIAGNIDNPEFNYMKLVWKTLGNLLVKVATSPARALGDLFKGDSDEVFITIDPAEADFTSEQYYQIDKVADMAKLDETVILNLELQTKPSEDSVIVANNNRRNKILQHHLTELGIPAEQVVITSATPNADLKKEGYAVTTELKIEN